MEEIVGSKVAVALIALGALAAVGYYLFAYNAQHAQSPITTTNLGIGQGYTSFISSSTSYSSTATTTH